MSENHKTYNLTNKSVLTGSIILSAMIIILAGYYYYSLEVNRLVETEKKELGAIGELKVQRISEQFSEEFTDLSVVTQNKFIVNTIREIKNTQSKTAKDLLSSTLEDLKAIHHCMDIIVIFNDGSSFATSAFSPDMNTGLLKSQINYAMFSGSSSIVDINESKGGEKYYGFLLPVSDKNKSVIATFIFFKSTELYLNPMLKSLPKERKTLEAYIFRQTEDSVYYLSDLKRKINSGSGNSIQAVYPDMPEVKFAKTNTNIVTGIDYSGEEVFAYVNKIAGTPWSVVVKTDKGEIFAGLLPHIIRMLIVVVLVILSIVAILSFVYNRNQKKIYMELYQKEKELWQSQEKFKVTLDSLGDGVITADSDGKIQYMNKMAETLTGWNIREARGVPLMDVYSVKNEETGEKDDLIIEKVIRHGLVKALANHTILVSKTGLEIPVVDTGAPIYDNNGSIAGIVLAFQDETEKRTQRRILENSEKRFRSSLDNLLEGCQILDRELRYVYLNDAAARHGHTSKEKLLNKKMTEVYPGVEGTHLYEIIRKCLENSVSHKMENEFTYPDGSKGWFNLSFDPIPEGIFILSIDVTEQKLSEKALHESKENYRDLVENINDILFSMNMDGIIEFVSPVITKILGYQPEEIAGKHYEEVFKETSNETLKFHLGKFKEGKTEPIEMQMKTKDGKMIWCRISRAPVFKNDKLVGIRGVISDITEKVKALEEMTLAKEKAEELNIIKTNFFANISHELRTPFVGIMGYSELLIETAKDPDTREMVEGILRTAKRMRDTITKILNLSRLEFNKMELVWKEIELTEILDLVYYQFKSEAEINNLVLIKKVEFDTLIINSDETLLKEILTNLLSNAIIYTNEGKVELSAEIEEAKNSRSVLIKVKDTGIGIENESQEIVWEMFRQASEGTSRNYQGLGLGLAIVKKYCELLGGSVEMKSEKSKGSEFTVKLPLK